MKKIMQNWIYYAVFGVGLGAIISTAAIAVSSGVTEELRQVIIWIIASGIIGLLSLVYELDSLNDLTATLIHAPLTVATALIAGSIAGYGEGSFTLLVMRMGIPIVVIYVGVHLLMYIIRRATVRSLNEKLSGK